VNGELKTGGNGTWSETNSQSDHVFTFTTVLEKPEGLLLKDPGRRMLFELNLRSRKMQWRLESEAQWHPLYDIVAVQ
jgi:hypothetical protein